MDTTLLAKAARTAIIDCLGLTEGETFLIVTNPGTEQALIAQALKDEADKAGIQTTLLFQPIKTQTDYAEPYVLDAISQCPDAFASISAEKLGKDPEHVKNPLIASDGISYDHIFHYLLHGTKQMRAFWSPGITLDMFLRTVSIDYSLMRTRAQILSQLLTDAEAVHIAAPSGTDISFSISGRNAFIDDGDFSKPGSGGNLPAGEVFISPALRSAEGSIVFDGSIANIAGDIIIKTPISCSVSGGFVLGAEGGKEAEQLEAALQTGMNMAARLVHEKGMDPEKALQYGINARHIGELGIGLNTEARITGNMLEDEKVYSTCHFAIGSNYDEDAPAMIHLDGLVQQPTITLLMKDCRELTIMKQGELVDFSNRPDY